MKIKIMFNFKKNKKSIFLTLAILLIFGSFFIVNRNENKDATKVVTVGEQTFQVEVVSVKNDLEKGLGGRDGLCLSCGMLFKFSQPGKYAFWMKDMKFPIDILWIYEGKIVHLEKNVSPTLVGTLSPAEQADSVLEINSGKSDEFGFKVGDNVKFHDQY